MTLPERIRLLLVEDVATDAEIELRELKRAGLSVEHRLVDTEEGFRLELERFAPHVIISDFSMPQFDGMAALALTRELHPEIPFLFVSGTIGEEYAIRALRRHTDYVLKTNLVRLPHRTPCTRPATATPATRRRKSSPRPASGCRASTSPCPMRSGRPRRASGRLHQPGGPRYSATPQALR
jgi:CheY-like chemotaxis protein